MFDSDEALPVLPVGMAIGVVIILVVLITLTLLCGLITPMSAFTWATWGVLTSS
jgi:hypothetical protein